jgi:hypothetical protein
MVGLVHELLLVVNYSPSFNCYYIQHLIFFDFYNTQNIVMGISALNIGILELCD